MLDYIKEHFDSREYNAEDPDWKKATHAIVLQGGRWTCVHPVTSKEDEVEHIVTWFKENAGDPDDAYDVHFVYSDGSVKDVIVKKIEVDIDYELE